MENKPNLQAILKEGFEDVGMENCKIYRKGEEMVLYNFAKDEVLHRYKLTE